MPHFHLALESGSDAVLAAMRRRYTAGDFRRAVERIRAVAPDSAITTDVIAGFPGETEAEFEETLAMCRECAFARLHSFPYSQRSRTAAARMPGQLPPEVRRERMSRLLALGGELAAAFRARFEGSVRPVLWESERLIDGRSLWFGHTDNYIGVYTCGEALGNRITPVVIGGAFADGAWGIPMAPAGGHTQR
jgi:threonylcarbamoyladenosine tRNA methylthiotransferase MtaB